MDWWRNHCFNIHQLAPTDVREVGLLTFPSSRHGCLSSGISPVLSLGMVVVRSETFVGCTGRRSVLRQGGFPLLSECLEGR